MGSHDQSGAIAFYKALLRRHVFIHSTCPVRWRAKDWLESLADLFLCESLERWKEQDECTLV